MCNIRLAAKSGDIKLVRDHVLADPSSVHTLDDGHVYHNEDIPHYLYGSTSLTDTYTPFDANARGAVFTLSVVIFVFFLVTEI